MSDGQIRWISGPVLRARTSDVFHVQEAIAVGPHSLPGEIIQLSTEELVAQVYEDTTGLKPGDAVVGTGRPLSVQARPWPARPHLRRTAAPAARIFRLIHPAGSARALDATLHF